MRVNRIARVPLLLLMISGVSCTSLKAPTPPDSDLRLRNAISVEGEVIQTGSVEQRMRDYRVPDVSVAVVENGRVVYRRAWGKETTPDTLFQAGSVSKVIAAIGAMEMVRERKLALDADVSRTLQGLGIFKGPLARKKKVTLRQLLSHSAGFNVPGFAGSDCSKPIPKLPEILSRSGLRLMWEPGTSWHYSGGGTSLVQLLMERATGEAFSAWMRERILLPLGMTRSRFDEHLGAATSASFAARGHAPLDQPIEGGWKCYPELAAAGLWSTPTELAQPLILLARLYAGTASGPPLDSATAREMLKTQMAPSGLGPMLSREAGALVFEHEGVNEGYVSRWHGFIQRLSDGTIRSGGIVVMTSSQNGEFLIDEIMRAVADRYGWPHLRPVVKHLAKRKPSAARLRSFAGRYQKAGEMNFLQILERDGSLYLQFNPALPQIPLLPESDTVFFARNGTIVDFEGPRRLSLGSVRPQRPTRWSKRNHSFAP